MEEETEPIKLRGHHLRMLGIIMDPTEYAQLLISKGYVRNGGHPFVRNTARFLAEIRASPYRNIRLLVGGEDYICSVCPLEIKAKCYSLNFKNQYPYGTLFLNGFMEKYSEKDDRQVILNCGLEAGIEQDIPISQVLEGIKDLARENQEELREFLQGNFKEG